MWSAPMCEATMATVLSGGTAMNPLRTELIIKKCEMCEFSELNEFSRLSGVRSLEHESVKKIRKKHE